MSDNKSFKVQNGLDVTGDANVSGSVTATSFIGDGSQLTGISGGSGGGLDSAAVNAIIDSELVGTESPNSYTLKIGADASRIAIGAGAVSERVNSISIGSNAGKYVNGGSGHIAIGDDAGGGALGGNGSATNTISIGTNAARDLSSAQYETIAIGYNAGIKNLGNYSIAIGSNASSSSQGSKQSVALGYNTEASNFAVAIGNHAEANGLRSIAIGNTATVTSDDGVTIGSSAAGSLTYDTTNDWVFGSSVTLPGATVSGHIIPDTNAAYDLGSAEKKFRHLYLSNNSLYAESGRLSFEGGQLTFRDDPVLMLSEVQAIAAASDTFEDFKAALASL